MPNIARIKILLRAEIGGYTKSLLVSLPLIAAVVGHVFFPTLAVIIIAVVLGSMGLLRKDSGKTAAFTLSLALTRREMFLARTLFVLIVAPIVVALILVSTYLTRLAPWLPNGFFLTVEIHDPIRTFVYLNLLLLAVTHLCLYFRILTCTDNSDLILVILLVLSPAFAGVAGHAMLASYALADWWLFWPPSIVIPVLVVSTTGLMCLVGVSFAHMEPGVGLFTGTRPGTMSFEKPSAAAARARLPEGTVPCIIPAVPRLDTIRYVRTLLWLESMGLVRHGLRMLKLAIYLFIVVLAPMTSKRLGQGIVYSLLVLPMLVGYEANPDAFTLGGPPFPQQFLFALAVPRRVYFRVKIAFWTALTFGLAVPIGLLCTLGVPEETTLPLPHRVADMVNAQLSAESLSALEAGVWLVPRELYANYIVLSSKAAYLLAAVCLLSVAYFFFWWLMTKSHMGKQGRLHRIQNAGTSGWLVTQLSGLLPVLLLFVVAFGFSGVILSYTFAFAYTHPFYLIFATIAVCLVLEQIAEWQFLNLEIVG